MPNKIRSYYLKRVNDLGAVINYKAFSSDSNTTLLPSGRPDLSAQNPYMLYDVDLEDYRQYVIVGKDGVPRCYNPPVAEITTLLPPDFSWSSADNQALARFNGKLRKGSASMGVTLASWKESRDMIISRSANLGKRLDKAYRRLKGDPREVRRLQKTKEPLANQVLEGEFGWAPLISDFYACMYTVCKEGVPPEWVRATGMASVSKSEEQHISPRHERRLTSGSARSTVAGQVVITNPNLWLLNRLGLINPAVAAWDLVPWSFLVNQVVNVNQMVSSVTDEVGLKISKRSTTRTSDITLSTVIWQSPAPIATPTGTATSVVKAHTKQRFAGSFPQVSWQVKVPKLNWESAVIATSLLLQKAQRISNLLRL